MVMKRNKDLPRCVCGGGVCVCGMDLEEAEEHYGVGLKATTRWGWAAHCMNCDVAIGKPGYYDPCASSEEDARRQWVKLIAKLKAEK